MEKPRVTHHRIVIAAIQAHIGLEEEIESPAGTMLLKPGTYLVTDTDGGQWVFTLQQLKELKTRPELN